MTRLFLAHWSSQMMDDVILWALANPEGPPPGSEFYTHDLSRNFSTYEVNADGQLLLIARDGEDPAAGRSEPVAITRGITIYRMTDDAAGPRWCEYKLHFEEGRLTHIARHPGCKGCRQLWKD